MMSGLSVCSTPCGITAIATELRDGVPGHRWCAQRLAASRPSLPVEHLGRASVRVVLNALRHHGHRYTVGAAISSPSSSSAQRLAASRPSLPCASGATSSSARASAQRLAASRPSLPLPPTQADVNAPPCSTPCGITAIATARRAHRGRADRGLVLNALRHHGHRYPPCGDQRARSGAVLNALRHHGHRYATSPQVASVQT